MKKSLLASAVLLAIANVSMAATAGDILDDGVTSDQKYELTGSYDNGVYVTNVTHSIESESILVDTWQAAESQTQGVRVVQTSSKDSVLNFGKKGVTQKIEIRVKDQNDYVNNLVMGMIVQGDKKLADNKEELNVYTKDLIISAQSKNGWVYGIVAQNGTVPESKNSNLSILNIDADNTYIDVNSGHKDNATAIVAMSEGIVNIEGNLFVNTLGGNGQAILARGDAVVNINQSGKHNVVLNGDIAFNFDEKTSKTPVDAAINILLKGEGSSWTGNSIVSWDGKVPEKDLEVSQFKLSLNEGASWTPTKTANDDPQESLSGAYYTAMNDLMLDGGVVNITGDNIDVTVENMTGSGTINLAVDGDKAGKFTVEGATDASLDVNLMDAKMENELSSDDINADQAKNLLGNVGGEGVATTTEV